MKKILISALLIAAVSAAPAFAAGDAAAGKALYGTCAACHGANAEGNKAMNAPKLAGQGEWYLVRQLANFKGGIRGTSANDTYGKTMGPMAMMLADDNAMANVAAYIASLPVSHPAATVQGDAAAGKTGYAMCSACHGADGRGNPAMNAPTLAGQSDFYLVTQLKNFKSGARGAHAKDSYGMQMASMAKMMADDAAINNVVAYINTLK